MADSAYWGTEERITWPGILLIQGTKQNKIEPLELGEGGLFGHDGDRLSKEIGHFLPLYLYVALIQALATTHRGRKAFSFWEILQ